MLSIITVLTDAHINVIDWINKTFESNKIINYVTIYKLVSYRASVQNMSY